MKRVLAHIQDEASASALRLTRQKLEQCTSIPLPAIPTDGSDAIASTITLPDSVLLKDLQHAIIEQRHLSWSDNYAQNVGMILPAQSSLVTLYVDANENVYFYFNQTPLNLYMSNYEWRTIGQKLPSESIFLGVFFTCQSKTVLGLFDLKKESGVWLNDSLLERHRRLYTIIANAALPSFVRHHWIGFASECYKCLNSHTLPFSATALLLLDTDTDSNCYRRIIAGISIPRPAPPTGAR